MIDYGVIYLLSIYYVTLVGEPNEIGNYTVQGPLALVPLLVWFFLLPFSEGITGYTLGRKLVGIKTLGANGTPIGWRRALKRRFLDFFEIWMSFGIIALIMAHKHPQKRRVGDLWADSYVVPRAETPNKIYGVEETEDEFSKGNRTINIALIMILLSVGACSAAQGLGDKGDNLGALGVFTFLAGLITYLIGARRKRNSSKAVDTSPAP